MWRQKESLPLKRNEMSEHAPTYHRQNGQSRPIYPDMYSAGAEIEVQYRTAAEVLFAAILREPHIFAAVAHKVHPAWWKQTKYDKAACAVFEQHYGTGKSYSAYTVCKPGGDVNEKDLFEIQGRHADTDLNAALDFFLPIYRQWVEFRASQFAQHGISQNWEAEQIRRAADDFRRDSHAYITQAENGNEKLIEWVKTKLSGNEIDYKCKPSLKTLIWSGQKRAYEPGEFVLVMARPAMGKTHFILDELDNFSRNGARGVFISMDMSKLQVQKRMIGKLTGINPAATWVGLSDSEILAISQTTEYIDNWPVVIVDDTVGLSEIISIIHAENYKSPIDYICVDYIQQIKTGEKRISEEKEVGDVSGALKHLGKVLGIPILAVCQLSRAVETRGGSKRPQLSDLRGSGKLEQDATVVIAPYRAEYYGILEDENGKSLQGRGEIIFLKNQNDGIFQPKVVGFDGIKGWYDIEQDPYEYHEQGKTVPAFPVTDFLAARPKLDDMEPIPF
jgi:hypothetical protein